MTVAAAYVRVSSASQTAAMQREAIWTAAMLRGDTDLTFYADVATGGTLERPELARLRGDVRAGLVPKLYVYRLDRLTRSGIRDTLAIVEELKRCGCQLVTLADGFDIDGPAAEVVLAVLAWASKMERLAIGERISAARVRVEAEGRTWGRPPRMSSEKIAKAQALAAAGKSNRAIAVALKIPRATVWRALQKPLARAAPKKRKKTGPG